MIFKLVILIAVVVVTAKLPPTSGVACKPGSFLEKLGNLCLCSETQQELCYNYNSKFKRNFNSGDSEYICEPGSTFNLECNTCQCYDGKSGQCTTNACQGSNRVARAARRCVPGSSWKVGCNRCWCKSNGQPRCTKRGPCKH